MIAIDTNERNILYGKQNNFIYKKYSINLIHCSKCSFPYPMF